MNQAIKWLNKNKKNIAHFYWLIATPSIVIIWPDHIPAVIAKTSAIIGVVLSSFGYTGTKAKEPMTKDSIK